MKIASYLRICGYLGLASQIQAQEYQSHFPPVEFQARWQRIFEQIGDQAQAVLQGAEDPGAFVYPRQGNDFYYLCGVENPGAYLVLDGRTRKVTLYLPSAGRPRRAPLNPAVPKKPTWERMLSLDDPDKVKRFTGVDEVRSVSELKAFTAGIIYTLFSPAEGLAQPRAAANGRNQKIAADYWDSRVSKEKNFIALLKSRHPQTELRDLTPLLDEMRSVKNPREIEVMRKAGQLAGQGLNAAMKATKPGVYEYQLEAAARFVFLDHGARLEGYNSTVASGVTNISNGHYCFNSSQLKDGDLVLMDYSPDYGYYTSDIGRVWPVNGKFAGYQREICQVILEYHKTVLSRIRPGARVRDIMADAAQAMEPILARTKFSKPEYENACRKMVTTGGGVFSHTVGMTVHDVGSYSRAPLKTGQVFSIDPAVRVPEENLYLRVEDTVAVTDKGVEVLTAAAPIELDEIEKMIQSGNRARER